MFLSCVTTKDNPVTNYIVFMMIAYYILSFWFVFGKHLIFRKSLGYVIIDHTISRSRLQTQDRSWILHPYPHMPPISLARVGHKQRWRAKRFGVSWWSTYTHPSPRWTVQNNQNCFELLILKWEKDPPYNWICLLQAKSPLKPWTQVQRLFDENSFR